MAKKPSGLWVVIFGLVCMCIAIFGIVTTYINLAKDGKWCVMEYYNKYEHHYRVGRCSAENMTHGGFSAWSEIYQFDNKSQADSTANALNLKDRLEKQHEDSLEFHYK